MRGGGGGGVGRGTLRHATRRRELLARLVEILGGVAVERPRGALRSAHRRVHRGLVEKRFSVVRHKRLRSVEAGLHVHVVHGVRQRERVPAEADLESTCEAAGGTRQVPGRREDIRERLDASVGRPRVWRARPVNAAGELLEPGVSVVRGRDHVWTHALDGCPQTGVCGDVEAAEQVRRRQTIESWIPMMRSGDAVRVGARALGRAAARVEMRA